jgi:hypothetical protein
VDGVLCGSTFKDGCRARVVVHWWSAYLPSAALQIAVILGEFQKSMAPLTFWLRPPGSWELIQLTLVFPNPDTLVQTSQITSSLEPRIESLWLLWHLPSLWQSCWSSNTEPLVPRHNAGKTGEIMTHDSSVSWPEKPFPLAPVAYNVALQICYLFCKSDHLTYLPISQTHDDWPIASEVLLYG